MVEHIRAHPQAFHRRAADPDERAIPRVRHSIAWSRLPKTAHLITAWVEDLTQRSLGHGSYLAPTTVAVHQRNIRVWARYLADEARTDDPTAATVAAFRLWANRFRRPHTVNALLEAIRRCYGWGAERQLTINIAETTENLLPDPDASPLPGLSDAAFAKAMAAIAGDGVAAARDRALLSALRGLPVDTIALARANVGALDQQRGIIHLVPRWGLSRWKRGVEATATTAYPVPPATLVYLTTYLQTRGRPTLAAPLFAALRGGTRMTTLGMRLVVLRTLVAAGLRSETPGLARHAQLLQYPRLGPADLPRLAEQLADHPDRARLLAILGLLAHPDTRGPLETYRVTDIDETCSSLLRKVAAKGPARTRVVSIPASCRNTIQPWLAERRGDPSNPFLFPGVGDAAVSHHVLRRLSWTPFPQQRAPRSLISSSSRLLRRSDRGGRAAAVPPRP